MRWDELLTGSVGIVYAIVAGLHYIGGRPGLALTFAAYAVANAGLIWAARR